MGGVQVRLHICEAGLPCASQWLPDSPEEWECHDWPACFASCVWQAAYLSGKVCPNPGCSWCTCDGQRGLA